MPPKLNVKFQDFELNNYTKQYNSKIILFYTLLFIFRLFYRSNYQQSEVKKSWKMEGLPGGCNPADVLFKLAHGRGIKPPVFDQVTEQGPPHAKTFTWSCSFFEVWKHLSLGFCCAQISSHQVSCPSSVNNNKFWVNVPIFIW